MMGEIIRIGLRQAGEKLTLHSLWANINCEWHLMGKRNDTFSPLLFSCSVGAHSDPRPRVFAGAKTLAKTLP